jgi:hypothetical protein
MGSYRYLFLCVGCAAACGSKADNPPIFTDTDAGRVLVGAAPGGSNAPGTTPDAGPGAVPDAANVDAQAGATTCFELDTCCSDPNFPAGALTSCTLTANDGIASACLTALSIYRSAGYCP